MATEQNHFHAPGLGRRVFIETYGCQMNVADSQLMGGILETSGYLKADSLEEADVILVNTCAVRERAEDRVISRVSSMKPFKTANPDLVLGVTGCMAEHLREQLLERAPVIDLIVGPDAYRRLPQLIDNVSSGHPIIDVKLDRSETYDGVADTKVDGIHGWVTIQRGCDKFCTFCIVPFVRGRERSCAPREVLRQTRALAAQGAREVTLLGQTVNSYRYEDVDFADLVQSVSEIDGIERIRFTSPYPLDFPDKLIKTIATNPKVMPYIHLPVQSGSDPVLASMKRGHTVAEYLELVDSLRSQIAGLSLSTDLIVGFPGESDADFQKTMDLVRAIRFDSAFMFLYSERSHTAAKKSLPDDVPMATKKARLQELISVQEAISQEVNDALIGSEVDVLVTGPSRRSETDFCGRTATFKTTIFPVSSVDAAPPGSVVRVRVESATSHTLKGSLL